MYIYSSCCTLTPSRFFRGSHFTTSVTNESTEELTSSIQQRLLDATCSVSIRSMGKTAPANTANSRVKDKSQIGVAKSASNSIQRKDHSRNNSTHRVPGASSLSTASVSEKDNDSSHARSPSDVSDDEETQSYVKAQTVPRRFSAVHEFATKISLVEYQCKLCSKVKAALREGRGGYSHTTYLT
jgi:hypothetical protein